MSENADFSHGPGEDVIDPGAGFLGWLAVGLLGFLAVATVAVLLIAATH